MKSVNKTQLIVISGSLVLIVLLLFANTQPPKNQDKPMAMSEHAGNSAASASASITTLVEAAKSKLTPAQKELISKLEGALKTAPDKKTAYENMVNEWDDLKKQDVAAYYVEQAAIVSPTETNWMEAGNRYYGATRFAQEADRPLLFGKAIGCYEKTITINPKNVDAKVNMGACYVEGSSDPMKGIGILKDVEKTDSNNVNLQLNFAFFSEKSGQWDKAIARFQKVLKIQPDFIEAYLHLADAYEQKGDKQKAIEYYEKYKNLVDDASTKTDIQDYINKLKNS
ncbi:MAG: hypothetical protein JWP12_634 [Bacteroidetes bacterium]|nr:hypothetical protein [Bacteroidota bacterium]